jgi:hypothetical protein
MKIGEFVQRWLGPLSVVMTVGVLGCDTAPSVWLGIAGDQPTGAGSGVFVSVEAANGRRVRITTSSGHHIIDGSTLSVMSCEPLEKGERLELSFRVIPDAPEAIVRAELLSNEGDDCAKGILVTSFQLVVKAGANAAIVDGGTKDSGGAGGAATTGTSGATTGTSGTTGATTGTSGTTGTTTGTGGAGGTGGKGGT